MEEWIDKLRIFPRIVLVSYMLSLGISLEWYLDFEVKYQTQCDSNTLRVLLDNGTKLELAQSIACTTVDTIGHPTGYTALMSTLVGSGAAIFGFYVNSGRKRETPVGASKST
jgi:hypothetical protein